MVSSGGRATTAGGVGVGASATLATTPAGSAAGGVAGAGRSSDPATGSGGCGAGDGNDGSATGLTKRGPTASLGGVVGSAGKRSSRFGAAGGTRVSATASEINSSKGRKVAVGEPAAGVGSAAKPSSNGIPGSGAGADSMGVMTCFVRRCHGRRRGGGARRFPRRVSLRGHRAGRTLRGGAPFPLPS